MPGRRCVLRGCIEVELFAAMVVFAVAFCHPVQPLADQGEHHRPDRQAECRAPNASLLVGVLEHLKGEGRDECSGGEGKHRRQHPLGSRSRPPTRAPSTKALEAITPNRTPVPRLVGIHFLCAPHEDPRQAFPFINVAIWKNADAYLAAFGGQAPKQVRNRG